MKKEYRAAAQRAIKESDLNGYKWTVTSTGLEWTYGETFTIEEKPCMDNIVLVVSTSYEPLFVGMVVGPDRYDDAQTVEEAYYKAVKATIAKANRLY